MTAFLSSLIFVVLAEMGDKTQLLAMAFATKYKWTTVLWGILAATVCNHLLAVLLGNYVTNFIPMSYVQIAAAVSFVLFGLWTIRGDSLDGEDSAGKYGAFLTVFIAFFMAEMGDKTQFATIVLAAQFQAILPVWLGTTSGMMIADAFGMLVGIVLGKRIPERFVKWFAAIIFIAFGLIGLFQALPERYVSMPYIMASIVMTLILMYITVKVSKN